MTLGLPGAGVLPLFVCLFVSGVIQKDTDEFHEIWSICRLWTREEFIEFWKFDGGTHSGYFIIFVYVMCVF